MEDLLELFEEFEEFGYVTRLCPDCKNECLPTEIDNSEAECPVCEKVVKVKPLI